MRIETSPSLAEGDHARSTNPLYARYGVGRVLAVRGDRAKLEFRPMLGMEPPYRSETKILPLAELARVPTPLELLAAGVYSEPWQFMLKVQAARLLTGNKGGQLSNARTEILPHQIFAAHRVVTSPRRRFLLADEVGLGKTIECGMIWQALLQRGQANRTLIICPAGLTTQWQEEMQDKFRETFEIFGRDFHAVNPLIWDLKARAIASLDTLKRREHKELLLENRNWNLIIFDEAHRLTARAYNSGKVERTQNYRLAEELRNYTDALLLVTATPHQGDENQSQFKLLLNLLEEEIDFSGIEGAHLFTEPEHSYSKYIIRTPKSKVTDAQGKRVFKGRKTHRLRFAMFADEARFYDAVESYIRDGYKLLEKVTDEKQKRAGGFLLTTFQKLNASSTQAIKSALGKRLIRLGEQSAAAVDEHGEADDERYQGEHEEQTAATAARALMEDEKELVGRLLVMPVKRDRKLVELLKLVDEVSPDAPRGDAEKFLIFTEYRQTQAYVVSELEARYGRGSVAVIHGGMELNEAREDAGKSVDDMWSRLARDGALAAAGSRRSSQRLFRESAKVRFLVSTEAGGEGINLQFCHICVNYDLPWNPMRVEQRVGRVYRYGQTLVVQVYNFYNEGTIEDKVQRYFERRLELAVKALSRVTGEDPEEIQATLNGQLELEIDPASIYRKALVEGELDRQSEAEIKEAIERARQAYEIATTSLFRDVSSYSFDSYQRELATDLSLGDLKALVQEYLSRNKRVFQQKADTVEFLVPQELRDRGQPERITNASFDRQQVIRRPDISRFLALGDPFIDALLRLLVDSTEGQSASFGATGQIPPGILVVCLVRNRQQNDLSEEVEFGLRVALVDSKSEVKELGWDDVQHLSGGEQEVVNTQTSMASLKQKAETDWGIWDWEEDAEIIAAAVIN